MAEHREKSQLIGDFLREIAVLMIVFYPLEAQLQGRFDWDAFGIVFACSMALLYFGMILEGQEEL